jgi:hypothetical protein
VTLAEEATAVLEALAFLRSQRPSVPAQELLSGELRALAADPTVQALLGGSAPPPRPPPPTGRLDPNPDRNPGPTHSHHRRGRATMATATIPPRYRVVDHPTPSGQVYAILDQVSDDLVLTGPQDNLRTWAVADKEVAAAEAERLEEERVVAVVDETHCGARHPKYLDVRCTQEMDTHQPRHEGPGGIGWALDAVRDPAPVHYAAMVAGAGHEILTEYGER